MGGLFRDLRRFLRTGSVVEIGAAFALATVGVELLAQFVNSFVIYPIQNTNVGVIGGDSGTFAIGHRLFEYENFLFQLLIVALVVGAVALVVRWNREGIFGDKTFTDCPHCLAEIPVGASVCSFCTREIPATAAD